MLPLRDLNPARRTPYVTWGLIGLIVGVLRWRKVFLAMPVVALAVVLLMPGVVQRMMDGFILRAV